MFLRRSPFLLGLFFILEKAGLNVSDNRVSNIINGFKDHLYFLKMMRKSKKGKKNG